MILGPVYPIAYWLLTAAATLRDELPAWVRGPTERRVAWDVQREEVPRPDGRHGRLTDGSG